MSVVTFPPSTAITPYVQSFEVVEVGQETTRTLLPEPGLVAGIRFSGSAVALEGGGARPLPDFTLTGLRQTARRIRTSAGGGVVLAKFREGGAGAFFTLPLQQLFGVTLGLDRLLGSNAVERARLRMQRAQSAAERVAIFEHLLLTHRTRWTPDPVVCRALDAIGTAK
ncbi:MAG TPA: AraC family transcriptional regulator, partial [Myxococcaceae bacterium]|nr:AraC family transcriptional regulator [Myxococcaceae bacterium]